MDFRTIGTMTCLLALLGCVGIPPLQTRVYTVNQQFWKSIHTDIAYENKEPKTYSDEKDASDMTKFLKDAGITFPKGAFVRIDQKINTVIMRNTPSELDHIERLIGPMDGVGNFYTEKRILDDKSNPVVPPNPSTK